MHRSYAYCLRREDNTAISDDVLKSWYHELHPRNFVDTRGTNPLIFIRCLLVPPPPALLYLPASILSSLNLFISLSIYLPVPLTPPFSPSLSPPLLSVYQSVHVCIRPPSAILFLSSYQTQLSSSVVQDMPNQPTFKISCHVQIKLAHGQASEETNFAGKAHVLEV